MIMTHPLRADHEYHLEIRHTDPRLIAKKWEFKARFSLRSLYDRNQEDQQVKSAVKYYWPLLPDGIYIGI